MKGFPCQFSEYKNAMKWIITPGDDMLKCYQAAKNCCSMFIH